MNQAGIAITASCVAAVIYYLGARAWQLMAKTREALKSDAVSDPDDVVRTTSGHYLFVPDMVADLANHVRVGLLACDARRILWANDAAVGILGHPREVLLSRSYLELIHPNDRPGSSVVVEANFQTVGPVRFRNRWIGADRSVRPVVWDVTPFDRHGVAFCYVRTEAESLEESGAHPLV